MSDIFYSFYIDNKEKHCYQRETSMKYLVKETIMAAKAKKVKKAKKAETSTVGTRFESRQREVVEQAAEIAGCSPARFIRDAAIERALSVVNASGPSEFRIRKLAAMLVDHLLRATVGEESDGEHTRQGVQSALYYVPNPAEGSNAGSGVDWQALREIREALNTCGTAFVRMLLDEWGGQGVQAEAYKPKIKPEDIL